MKHLILVASIACATILGSCSKDDSSVKQLSQADAKVELQKVSSNFGAEYKTMQQNKGIKALVTLSEIADKGLLPSSFASIASLEAVKSSLSPLRNPIAPVLKGSETPFDFNKKGKYTYTNGKFVFSTTTTKDIVIAFPTEGSTKNNAVLTLSKYAEIYVAAQEANVPTQIEANLTVDNVVVFKISYNAAFGELLNGLGTNGVASADLSMSFAPYTLESHDKVSMNQGKAVATSSTSFKNGNQQLVSTQEAFNISLNEKTKDVAFNGDVALQINNLKLEGKLSLAYNMDGDFDYKDIDINKAIKLAAFTFPAGDKIGDIIANKDKQGKITPMIVYGDGTKESLLTYFNSWFGNINK